MLKIVIKTPTRIIYKGEAESVTLPTYDGDIQIFEKHINLITSLDIGFIKIFGKDNNKFMCFKGIATINDNVISVLTEEALMPKDDILKEIQKAIELAQQGKPVSPIQAQDLIRAEKQLRYYLLKEEKQQ